MSCGPCPFLPECSRIDRDLCRSEAYGPVVELLVLVTGSLSVVLLVAWWLRRSQNDVDEVDQAEYRPPPVHGGTGPH